MSSGFAREHGHAAGLELRRIRLVLAAREDVHLVRHDDIHEADEFQDLPPLCIQQSTGNSAAPELDVVAGVLGHLPVDEDVANLHATTWF